MATLTARNCNLSSLVKIVLVLLNRKNWQLYLCGIVRRTRALWNKLYFKFASVAE